MKNEQLIKNLIKEGESDQLEFKEVVRKEEIAKVLCGFLNGQGGRIIIGIKDNGEIASITESENVKKLLNDFLIRVIVPEAPITISVENISDKSILMVKVYGGSKQPYIYDGNIYYRKGTITAKATSKQISELIHDRQKAELHWERQTALGVDFDDLDQKLIVKTMKESQRNNRGNYKGYDPLEFLSHYGLYQNGGFTNACVVLFAKSPVRFLPQIRIRLTEYAEGKTGDNLLRDELFEGNLFEIQDNLERYTNGLGIRSVFDKNQWKRIDFKFPAKALQEGIINALMHRDYSLVSSGVSISVYPDRFVISNSGHLPDDLKVSDLKKNHRAHPVNPDIAHVVFLRGLIDKLGRGTLKIIKECRDAGLKDPAWKDTTEGIILTFSGPKSLPIKKDTTLGDGANDGVIDGVIDGVNKLLDDGVIDGVIDGVSSGVKIEIIKIIYIVRDNPGINANAVADSLDKSKPTIERYLRTAKDAGLIEFKGATKTGGYELTGKLNKEID